MREKKEFFGVTPEALSQAIGHLIELQDQECSRIARELHEDIGASLTVLGIDLLRAGKSVADSSGGKHPDIKQIYEKLQEIGSRVSRLSDRLNPPMLKYFGLAKAIESECKELSQAGQIQASFSCKNIPARLDPAIALNLFRVAQEALRNAGKHSHAASVSVDLTATSEELTLAVSDAGVGFDLGRINAAAGLGLIGMRERTRLIGGEFELWSKPGHGVKILCRAPLPQSS